MSPELEALGILGSRYLVASTVEHLDGRLRVSKCACSTVETEVETRLKRSSRFFFPFFDVAQTSIDAKTSSLRSTSHLHDAQLGEPLHVLGDSSGAFFLVIAGGIHDDRWESERERERDENENEREKSFLVFFKVK